MKHSRCGARFALRISCWAAIWATSCLIFSTVAQAQSIVFQEDFSAGLEKWEILRNNPTAWSIKDGQAEAYIPTGSTLAEMIPKDAYWSSDWKNIEYELDYTPLEGVDKNISFGFQNVSNWYEIHFVDTAYNLVRVTSQGVPFSATGAYIMNNGQTYRIKIRLNQGRIEVFINGQKMFDKVDPSFNQNYGKIGVKAGTGAVAPTRVRYDNITVRTIPSIDGTELAVPLYKQSDPVWKNHEYDTATSWSTFPSIGRWGCALTSLAMVMRFHGLHTLPDGTDLNPDTLNTWLKSQPDGYIGQGALNWIAATRLTRLINEKLGTPKLEYKRNGGANQNLAQTEIKANKPVIFEIAGHFLVGSGVTASNTDFHIKDPAYSYTKFSQHHTELLSTRTFQPSQTDLSYILITHAPGLQISVTDINGQPVPGFETFTDTITDHVDGTSETTPALVQRQLAQPTSGKYVIKVWQNQLKPFSFQVLSYDQAANPTALEQRGWVGTQALTFTLNYTKTATNTPSGHWQNTYSFGQLSQDLKNLHAQKHIKVQYVLTMFDQVIAYGEKSSLVTQKRYVGLLRNYLTQYKLYFTSDGYNTVDQRLKLLEQTINQQP